ncbi:hypothetical protein Tco_0778618 [Tanacetum coccineum]
MKELSPARKILGMEIVRDRVGLCATGSTLQGSLMYLMVCTRSDIAYAISIVSRYLANLDQGKRVYVDGFVDAYYAKDPDKGSSITAYMFMVHDECEIDRAADGKLRDKNDKESLEIIENLALFTSMRVGMTQETSLNRPSELNEVDPIEKDMEDDNESVGGMKEELTRGEKRRKCYWKCLGHNP